LLDLGSFKTCSSIGIKFVCSYFVLRMCNQGQRGMSYVAVLFFSPRQVDTPKWRDVVFVLEVC
jgi:hypothetical protein